MRQCVLRGGLPFSVELPQYKPEVVEAMEEARRISKDTREKDMIDFLKLWRIWIEERGFTIAFDNKPIS